MSMKEIKQSVEEVVEDLDSFRIVLRASVTHESTRAKLLKELEELQKNVTQALQSQRDIAVGEERKRVTSFIWKELSLTKEPMPSANDSSDYNKGVKNGFDYARAFVSRVLQSLTNKQHHA